MSRGVLRMTLFAFLPLWEPVISTSAQAPMPRRVKTTVLVVSPSDPLVERVEPVEAWRLEGSYSKGMLGCYLDLTLGARGKFSCTWSGCLGVYGTASGEWALDEHGIRILTKSCDGMLKERPLGRLQIVPFQGHFLLVPQDHRDLLEEFGVAASTCLHQGDAERLIREDQNRRLKALLDYNLARHHNLRLEASTIGLLGAPFGQGPLLGLSALLPAPIKPMPSKQPPRWSPY